MNGRMGSAGQVMTYHNLTFLSGSFWQIFKENRVFVIFDEIHHCIYKRDFVLAHLNLVDVKDMMHIVHEITMLEMRQRRPQSFHALEPNVLQFYGWNCVCLVRSQDGPQ